MIVVVYNYLAISTLIENQIIILLLSLIMFANLTVGPRGLALTMFGSLTLDILQFNSFEVRSPP